MRRRHPGATFVRRQAPPGEGSGRAHVERRVAGEVRRTAKRLSHTKTRLIVVVDADSDTMEQAVARIEQHAYPGVTKERHVLTAVPRRNVETWMAFSSDMAVDESTDYKNALDRSVKASEAGRRLAERVNDPNQACPELPALQAARDRYLAVFVEL